MFFLHFILLCSPHPDIVVRHDIHAWMGAGALRVYLLPSVKQEAEPVSADMASCPEAAAELCRAIMIALIHLQDAEMMEQIDRDVMRTHPGLHFFSGDDGSAVTHREVTPLRQN